MTEFTKIGGLYKFADLQLEKLLARLVSSINGISDGFLFSTKSISAAYSVGKSDHCLLVTTTSGGVTVTLPAASAVPFKIFIVKKVTTDANAVTIATAGGTIDGGATLAFTTSRGMRMVISDGSNYAVIGQI
jgi:hypothetical protein